MKKLSNYKDGDRIPAEAYRQLVGLPQPWAPAPTGSRFPNESAFTDWVCGQARKAGWGCVYHTWNSKRSEPGFYDVRALDPPHVLVVELKMPGQKPTPDQVRWLNGEARCTHGPWQRVCLWYPDMEAEILAYITDPAQNPPPGIWSPAL